MEGLHCTAWMATHLCVKGYTAQQRRGSRRVILTGNNLQDCLYRPDVTNGVIMGTQMQQQQQQTAAGFSLGSSRSSSTSGSGSLPGVALLLVADS